MYCYCIKQLVYIQFSMITKNLWQNTVDCIHSMNAWEFDIII